jgi:response regulator of citrate/malate metabolism
VKQRLTKMKQAEQAVTNSDPSPDDSDQDSTNTRQERLLALLKDPATQMTQSEMAEYLGVSLSTVRRDLKFLNGQAA